MRNVLKLFYSLAIVGMLSSCVMMTQPVRKVSSFDEESAYLYGHFKLNKPEEAFVYPRAALEIGKVANSKTQTFEFTLDGKARIIELPPGKYFLRRFIFTSLSYEKLGVKPLPDPYLVVPFEVKAGKAYYIADFNMFAESVSNTIEWKHSWFLSEIKHTFADTTKEVLVDYPQMEKAEMVNLFSK